MSKIRNIVVGMAIMSVINLPVCASSYAYVTVSPSSNEVGTTIENVVNSVNNTTSNTKSKKKMSLNDEKEVGLTLVDRRNKAMKFLLIQATFSGTI